jgi:hypothetical protein
LKNQRRNQDDQILSLGESRNFNDNSQRKQMKREKVNCKPRLASGSEADRNQGARRKSGE